MKLDLNIPVLDLLDVPIKDVSSSNPEDILTCAKMLGGALVNSDKTDAIKYYDWARALYRNKPIDIDNADFKKLRDFVDKAKSINTLATAQILIAMDECEKRSKEEVKMQVEKEEVK